MADDRATSPMDSSKTASEEGRGEMEQINIRSSPTESGTDGPPLDQALSASTATLSLQPVTNNRNGAFSDPTPRAPPAATSPPNCQPALDSEKVVEPDEKDMLKAEEQSPDQPPGDVSTAVASERLDKDLVSSPEIQTIMDQFEQPKNDPTASDQPTPATSSAELPESAYGTEVRHPPRNSSLEAVRPSATAAAAIPKLSALENGHPPRHSSRMSVPPSDSPRTPGFGYSEKQLASSAGNAAAASDAQSSRPHSPVSGRPPSLHKALPPAPDPEPDLPFDFHRFLEQLKHRSADPVAKYLRSFLAEFGKKNWMAHEQTKIVSDFLAFITNRMAHCEVWHGVSDAEFDNAREGMEKLVMNRLYNQTFSPAILPPVAEKAKRRLGERGPGPGRRGQHQEDVERDAILAQKIQIYQWIREEHLDLKPFDDSGRRFLKLAQQELSKIKTYRAPRDKIICILNCCKVIFGLLRNAKSDQSADSFMPLLIYVVLHANPEHMVSNVQYILRFRHQEKQGGEAGYYLSSLMGAIQFIESLDRTSLTISDDEFEKHVEASVSAIAEEHKQQEQQERQARQEQGRHMQIADKSLPSQPEVTSRNSMEGERSTPRRAAPARDGVEPLTAATDEQAAVAGLLRSIQRPLSTIGRMFSEDSSSRQPSPRDSPSMTSQRKGARRPSPVRYAQDRRPSPPNGRARLDARARPTAEDDAARQASAEAAEAQRIQRLEHRNVVETLSGMFPGLDREVIDDVVREKEGRVGLAVDACLALSA